MLGRFRQGKGKQDEASRSSSRVQTPESPPEDKTQCLDCSDISRLYKADFATYFGKAMFDCGLAKAIIHLDMVNNQVDMGEVIRELENIYKIPRAQKPNKELLEVSGSSLFTGIFHLYNSKDSPEDMARVQQKLFSNILASCRKLQKTPAELVADNARQDSPFASNSSLRSSTPHTPPPTDINSDLPSGADNRARRPSTPPSEYRSVTPSTETSQISYEYISKPPQTPQRPSQSMSPTPADSPRCKRCRNPTIYKLTRMSNRNGNGGRPYFKCDPCGKFHSFADDQGINQYNPYCQCGQPSRLEQASKEKGGLPFFVCATGACDFYTEPSSPQSQASASPIPEMQGMSIR